MAATLSEYVCKDTAPCFLTSVTTAHDSFLTSVDDVANNSLVLSKLVALNSAQVAPRLACTCSTLKALGPRPAPPVPSTSIHSTWKSAVWPREPQSARMACPTASGPRHSISTSSPRCRRSCTAQLNCFATCKSAPWPGGTAMKQDPVGSGGRSPGVLWTYTKTLLRPPSGGRTTFGVQRKRQYSWTVGAVASALARTLTATSSSAYVCTLIARSSPASLSACMIERASGKTLVSRWTNRPRVFCTRLLMYSSHDAPG
mmetsp:Transcript_110925/g.324479  ORF Transcript_110925/g.324479 Transcript_110925/m.324479 type:complete len:258 (-) Transcript_110925:355-1128(-)